MSKYGVFSGPYFPAFGLNTERYSVREEKGKTKTIHKANLTSDWMI